MRNRLHVPDLAVSVCSGCGKSVFDLTKQRTRWDRQLREHEKRCLAQKAEQSSTTRVCPFCRKTGFGHKTEVANHVLRTDCRNRITALREGDNPQLLDAVAPTRHALEEYKTANDKMRTAFNNRLGKMKGLQFDGNDNDHKAAVERISKTSRMVLLPRWKTFRQMTNIGFCGLGGNIFDK